MNGVPVHQHLIPWACFLQVHIKMRYLIESYNYEDTNSNLTLEKTNAKIMMSF